MAADIMEKHLSQGASDPVNVDSHARQAAQVRHDKDMTARKVHPGLLRHPHHFSVQLVLLIAVIISCLDGDDNNSCGLLDLACGPLRDDRTVVSNTFQCLHRPYVRLCQLLM